MPRKETCIYCGQRPGLTNDHVPSKGFFEKRCPVDAQRMTVPCCESCRREDEKIDAFARNIIAGLLETEPTSYVSTHITDRVTRSVQQARWEFRRLWEIIKIKPATILTDSGPVNVLLPAFDTNIPEMNRFFERVARAVLYDAFHKGYFAGRVRWSPLNHIPDSLRQLFNNQGKGRAVLDVFEYNVSPPFNSGTYLVLVTFYKVKIFIIQVREIQA